MTWIEIVCPCTETFEWRPGRRLNPSTPLMSWPVVGELDATGDEGSRARRKTKSEAATIMRTASETATMTRVTRRPEDRLDESPGTSGRGGRVRSGFTGRL